MSEAADSNHAAIDIGTNSFHLLVATVGRGGEFTVLTTDKEMVRLGEGPGDIRELSQDAIDRGIASLARFKAIADSFDATLHAVATSAVREASNGSDFVARAQSEVGVTVDVISGFEEARLIHLGVLQALPVFDQQLIMVDIGGGSTEILVGKSGRALAARSLRIGHLRLTNRFFPGGEVTKRAAAECRSYVESFLVPVIRDLGPLGYQVAVGSSGTVEAIGDIIRFREHGDAIGAGLDTVITRDALLATIKAVTRWKSPIDRAANVDGLSEKRADVIVAGAILLDEIFAGFSIERMITSPYALREGVLLDRTLGIEMGRYRLADLRRDSLMRMVDSFEEDRSDVQHATELALALFDELAPLHGLNVADRHLLEAAGLLHNVGLFVSHAAHHLHSEYIIRNSDQLTGYTQAEIEVIAQVARYHRKSGPKSSHPAFMALPPADQNRVRWLAGILRIAIALDRTHQRLVGSVDVSIDDVSIVIEPVVSAGSDVSVEVYAANDRSALLAEVSGREVSVTAQAAGGR